MPPFDEIKEKKIILSAYSDLMRSCRSNTTTAERKQIRMAFEMAADAHKEMRRKSGEPYILHPVAVAKIVSKEMGLGTTSIIAALLHDVVEDTDITLKDLEMEFGKTVAKIVDGLTKITEFSEQTVSKQAENFKKMLLTMADDVRVVLIKLADRLHNMRTLGSMAKEKQLKICSETSYVYAPLAHRLGLFNIKTELEDLSLKYTQPDIYKEIEDKLADSKKARDRFIRYVTEPIKKQLDALGLKYQIKARLKSVYSIRQKIIKQNISFDQVYDIFAIRIILDSTVDIEKSDCLRVYSLITDLYTPNPKRTRDWITTPKSNGYESIHTTVMTPKGRWVEVQIRSKRMDEVAEKGLAAHWKYKDASAAADRAFEDWLAKVRQVLEDPSPNALEFIDDFKTNLFAHDIFVFTPKGDLITMPQGSTALDFAFEIHTQIGMKCIGAKINHKLVPLSHVLHTGDQVEILTSNIQHPTYDWLNFVKTHRAKSNIKTYLKEKAQELTNQGQEKLVAILRQLNVTMDDHLLLFVQNRLGTTTALEFYRKLAEGQISAEDIKKSLLQRGKNKKEVSEKASQNFEDFINSTKGVNDDLLVLDDSIARLEYRLAGCCHPIPGDNIFGFVGTDHIEVHRVNCENAPSLLAKFGFKVVKSKWGSNQEILFLVGIRVEGIDEMGIIQGITQVVTSDFKINMRSMKIFSNDGTFDGTIYLYAKDTSTINQIIRKLIQVKGVHHAERVDAEEM
jgi:guanosine-3',5'-bis(diphosphate) 3'-pyrophosphohydrolase